MYVQEIIELIEGRSIPLLEQGSRKGIDRQYRVGAESNLPFDILFAYRSATDDPQVTGQYSWVRVSYDENAVFIKAKYVKENY